jgi:hypothetical protein
VTLPRNMLMPTPSKPAAAQHIRPATKVVDTALAVTGAFGAPAGPVATVQLIRQQSATNTTSIQQDAEREKHNISRLFNLAKKHGSKPSASRT